MVDVGDKPVTQRTADAGGRLRCPADTLALVRTGETPKGEEALPGFTMHAHARTSGQTGMQMEGLTAVAVACLTLFDMLKTVDRTMEIGAIPVDAKRGGRSGAWRV